MPDRNPMTLDEIAAELGISRTYAYVLLERAALKLCRPRTLAHLRELLDETEESPDPWMAPGCRRVPPYDPQE